MDVRYHFTRSLPHGVVTAVIEREDHVLVLMDDGADHDDLAREMSRALSRYARQAWMHIGVLTPQEREAH